MDFGRISVVLLDVAILVMACARSPKAADASPNDHLFAPSLIVTLSDSLLRVGRVTDTVDMGRIRVGEVVKCDLLVRNVDSKPFVILSVATSCGCTTIDFSKEPLLPGQDAPFSFEFDSRGFNGYQLKHITISTSLAPQPFTLVATGEVIPAS